MNAATAHFVEQALLHAIEIASLAGVVAAVNRWLGRRWPHAAYALWLVVLLKCVTPPLVTLNLLPSLASVPAPSAEAVASPAPVATTAADAASNATTTAATTDAAPTTGLAIDGRLSWPPVLLAAWACGAVLLAGVSFGRNAECRRFLRHQGRPLPPGLARWFADYCEQLRIAPPQVVVTNARIGPAMVGVLRPTIFLPAELVEQSTPERLELVLAHEAAHVRRRDAWVALLQLAVQVVWWPYPVVWWVNRQIIRQRERCCDEEVVASLSDRRHDYAQSLVDVLELSCQPAPALPHLGLRPVQLVQTRLEEIMTRSSMTQRRGARWTWGLALLLSAAVLPFGVGPLAPASTSAAENPAAAKAAKPKQDQPRRLEYGDGRADGKKSLGGSGQLIEFTLPAGEPGLKAIRIHGSRYGTRQAPQEDFDIAILSEDMQEVIAIERAPYGLFRRGDQKWVTVRFKEPIQTPQRFWVALNFHAAQTKGVYVSFDDSTGGEHSRIGLAEEPDQVKPVGFDGDWMIQALLDWK